MRAGGGAETTCKAVLGRVRSLHQSSLKGAAPSRGQEESFSLVFASTPPEKGPEGTPPAKQQEHACN